MAKDNNEGIILLYQTDAGGVTVNVRFEDETFWLTQKAMAELFDVDRTSIGRHLKNIFADEELDEKVVSAVFAHTTSHGAIEGKTQTGEAVFYNLDAAIAVGYRVNSKKATRFRQWATRTLKEYVQKGFVINDEYLKNGRPFGKDYFRELLERVRSIRASERRIWQQITDIFAECSVDYDRDTLIVQDFYATIQNKFHYAITGQTAAEIVYENADATKDHMGLSTWKNSPDGRILKSDVTIAKNYLPEKDIRRLERAVSGYFDYIEELIENETAFTMEQFIESVNEFIAFRKYKLLTHRGRISRAEADKKAEAEYDIFNKTQIIVSDFDKSVKRLTEKIKPGGEDE